MMQQTDTSAPRATLAERAQLKRLKQRTKDALDAVKQLDISADEKSAIMDHFRRITSHQYGKPVSEKINVINHFIEEIENPEKRNSLIRAEKKRNQASDLKSNRQIIKAELERFKKNFPLTVKKIHKAKDISGITACLAETKPKNKKQLHFVMQQMHKAKQIANKAHGFYGVQQRALIDIHMRMVELKQAGHGKQADRLNTLAKSIEKSKDFESLQKNIADFELAEKKHRFNPIKQLSTTLNKISIDIKKTDGVNLSPPSLALTGSTGTNLQSVKKDYYNRLSQLQALYKSNGETKWAKQVEDLQEAVRSAETPEQLMNAFNTAEFNHISGTKGNESQRKNSLLRVCQEGFNDTAKVASSQPGFRGTKATVLIELQRHEKELLAKGKTKEADRIGKLFDSVKQAKSPQEMRKKIDVFSNNESKRFKIYDKHIHRAVLAKIKKACPASAPIPTLSLASKKPVGVAMAKGASGTKQPINKQGTPSL